MPHHVQKPQKAEVRAIIMRAIVEILRTYYQAYFKSENFGVGVDAGLIIFAVVLGQAEEKLMTATDISNYLGIPRATVSRKLKLLGRRRALRTMRNGKRVCYFVENPNAPEMLRAVEKVIGIIRQSNRQLSKMIDVGIDRDSAKP